MVAEKNMVYCHECNRGGNGNDKDKCACGWKQYEKSSKGCFLGLPIVGEIKPRPKVSRAKQRYQRYLKYGDMFDSFLSFCYWDAKKEREWNV